MLVREFKEFVAAIDTKLDDEEMGYIDLGYNVRAEELRAYKSDECGVLIDDCA